MEKIKLIALDLDGTLLDSQKRLSQRNEKALKACIERGIWIVPCTGRIWNGVPDFIRNIPGIRYGITTNGAMVEDISEHRVLDERKLSWELALDILQLARQFHTMYDVYMDGVGYGEARFMENMSRFQVPDIIQKMIRQTRTIVPDVMEEVRRRRIPAEKVNYFFGDQEERARARAALLERGDVVVSSSLSNNLEINAIGATKGEAILRLAKHLGLKQEETMGFGDGENDVTMMRLAGVGVAMKNAEEALKQEADYVTDSNDEDGVAVMIEKLVLNNI